MKFTESLKKNFQFRHVYHRGRSLANRYIVVYVIRNGTKQNRLGISVSKKVGKSVIRSRVTRLIKESYRVLEPCVRPGFDIVVIARVSANGAPYTEVLKSLQFLLKKQNLYDGANLCYKNKKDAPKS